MFRRIRNIAGFVVLEILLLLGIALSAVETIEYEAYMVQSGQTLESIAAEYRLPAEYLAQFNNMRATDALTQGQVIMVPLNTQLAPQTPAFTGEAQSPSEKPIKNPLTGLVGTVSAAHVQILEQPGRGRSLFDNATRGTDLLLIGQAKDYYAVLMSDGRTGWLPKSAVTLSETRVTVERPIPPPTQPGRQELVETAFEYLGIPYRLGGRLPDSVDCSLLVQTVYKRHGLRLPRTAAEQYQVGTPVPVSELQPGDRLYFYDRGTTRIGHTAMYIGNGRFIHASSNRKSVAVDDLSNSTYWSIYAGARR